MTQNTEQKVRTREDVWFIKRHGAWFRPNAAGYCVELVGAGTFSKDRARSYLDVDGIEIFHVSHPRIQSELLSLRASYDRFWGDVLAPESEDEAEARGAAEQRRKDAEISRAELFCRDQNDASDRTPERADVVQWQKDQNEFFMSNVLEIVTEYAAWRDRKDAEGQEPIGYLSMTGLEQLASALHGYANLRRLPASDDFILKWGPDIPLYNRPANVAALEARVKELEDKLKHAERWAEVAHTSCMGTGPKQALGETLNGLHQFLAAALKHEGSPA